MMRCCRFTLGAAALLCFGAPAAQAAPCLTVTLTGTQSGPAVFNGQAGAGIRGMRERAALVWGDLVVRSPEDGGTEVRLDLPLGALVP